MKVCLINNLYKPYNRGGAEAIVEIIANGLKEKGHEVFIVTTKSITNPKKAKDDLKVYRIRAFNLTSYYNLRHIPKIFRIFWHLFDMFDVISSYRAKSIFKKEKPDTIITNNLKGLGLLMPRIIKKLKIKHIHVLHDIQLLHPSGLMFCSKEKKLDSRISKIYKSLTRPLIASPDIIISPSRWLLDLHSKNNFFKKSELKTIANPIKIKNNTSINNNPKKFNFLFVGQIEEHKGVLPLINSYTRLCQNNLLKNSSLTFIGKGKLVKDAKKLSLNNKNIKFLGWLNREEYFKVMKESSCMVVPSLCYENSPTVIYEAASIGLPVLASRLGGIPELIHNFGGFLYNPKNEGDLMYQMKWIYNNQDKLKKISARSKEKIKKLAQNIYIDKLLKIIK